MKNDGIDGLMDIVAIITIGAMISPVMIIIGAIILMVLINPITWIGSFLIWFNKRVSS
jgi:hypothetical protein